MKLDLAKYLIILLFLINCGKQESEVKNYGFSEMEKDSLEVSLKLSEFENYGMFVDKIHEITCNDSIPKIVIEKKYLTRNIYPIEYCEPIPANPKEKHYVTFRRGKPYHARSAIEIDSDSLISKLRDDFSYYRNLNNLENLECYLVIIEAERSEKVNGIETFLNNLTQEFDKLESDLKLNISFWEVVPFTALPYTENEKQTE